MYCLLKINDDDHFYIYDWNSDLVYDSNSIKIKNKKYLFRI